MVNVTKNHPVANGVAFFNGSLFVALVDRIYRYDNVANRLDKGPLDYDSEIVGPSILPNDTWHGWRYIRFSPADNKLYLAVGAPCNVPGDERTDCVDENNNSSYFGKIIRMYPNGSNIEVFAKGIRNSVGFDFHPTTNELWFTDNGRDNMDQPDHNNMPPDELNHAPKEGLHFGFPYCYGMNISDNKFSTKNNCSLYNPAIVELQPHAAAIGMRFYNKLQFPGLQKAVFIAEHGSWNRNPPGGYRVTVVRFDDNGKPTDYSPFIHGWLSDPPKNCTTDKDCGTNEHCQFKYGSPYCSGWGRPSDIEVLKDGSLLISDETRGTIYRVTFQDPQTNVEIFVIIVISIIFLLLIVVGIIAFFIQRSKRYVTIQ